MHVVIDIDRLSTPEDQFYFFYNQDGDMFFGRSIYDCKKVVVLPEHHGRLIDADKLLDSDGIIADSRKCHYIPMIDVYQALTIIEADKEKEG